MKILHTSDWHLGHQLYNHDRTEEQVSMLLQMENIVRQEKPDLMLLCGDVFHVSQPSAASQKLFVDHIMRIKDAWPSMHVVITAGNHDSASRHEAFSTLWKRNGIRLIGTISPSPEDHIIKIEDKGYVVAVPYVSDRNLPEGFIREALQTVEKSNIEGKPVILTAHTTVMGASYKGHEDVTEYTVGSIEGKAIEDFGEDYDYLALGHIHHHQFIHTGRHNARYSGSPLAVSFDEDYAHSVSIVELQRHGEIPEVREIEIENPRPLVNLPKSGVADWETVRRLLEDFPADLPAYIRMNVEVEDILPPGAAEEAYSLTKGKACRFCHINTSRKRKGEKRKGEFTIHEMKREKPLDIARRYAEESGITFDEELESLFREAESQI